MRQFDRSRQPDTGPLYAGRFPIAKDIRGNDPGFAQEFAEVLRDKGMKFDPETFAIEVPSYLSGVYKSIPDLFEALRTEMHNLVVKRTREQWAPWARELFADGNALMSNARSAVHAPENRTSENLQLRARSFPDLEDFGRSSVSSFPTASDGSSNIQNGLGQNGIHAQGTAAQGSRAQGSFFKGDGTD